METQHYQSRRSGATLLIIEDGQLRQCDLSTRDNWILGRFDPNRTAVPDILFRSRLVSREHSAISRRGDAWYYADAPGNLNGSMINGRRTQRSAGPHRLRSGDLIRIDRSDVPGVHGVLILFTEEDAPGTWTDCPVREGESVYIGRDQGCTVCLPLPYISARHAEIRCRGGEVAIRDCDSRAGTYLNGSLLTEPAFLRERDCIAVCDCSMFYLGDRIVYKRRSPVHERESVLRLDPGQRPVILKADIQTKQVKNNAGAGMIELIRDIRLEVREGTLVALLATAGAGKSTVMNCLNGMDLEGVKGSVTYRGVDLMKNFDRMKHLIGSVPQQKIFREMNTPEEELYQAALARLPADTTNKEIRRRVDETLEMLGMTQVRRRRNSKLSGGEQTRVNVGIELVADRDLLCLDEPEQGVDPYFRKEIFEILQGLAHRHGKSVLCITHCVDYIDLFDQVIMLFKCEGVGRLAFAGSPQETREYFGVENIGEVYDLLVKDPQKYVR